ncbi:hypothetical protein R20233_03266 [Ralstonia sp. LMG 32965]|nr:hypothetical protein R20233_03266 [Ralstonia sp. LMG 32965]
MTARHNTTHRPQGWQNGLCEDAKVTAPTQTSMTAYTSMARVCTPTVPQESDEHLPLASTSMRSTCVNAS